MNHPNRYCIRLEKKKFNNSLFQQSVDATYIIHLEDNGRLPSVEEELKSYQPTNTVYIVFNKGFTNCKKVLPYKVPARDLVDTFFYIFQDANEKKYENILILEDDFIFTADIHKENHLRNINNFLIEKKSEKMMYYLGCLLWFQVPYNSHTNINLMSSGTHSVFYTYSARIELMKKKIIPVFDWDIYNNCFSGIRRYVYKQPLCYQLFPETENSKNWPSLFGFDPVKLYIKYNYLDRQLENGYSNTYTFSKYFGYFVLLLLVILVFWIIYYYWKKIKNKNIYKKIRNKK
jgi:hypothetical protein